MPIPGSTVATKVTVLVSKIEIDPVSLGISRRTDGGQPITLQFLRQDVPAATDVKSTSQVPQ